MTSARLGLLWAASHAERPRNSETHHAVMTGDQREDSPDWQPVVDKTSQGSGGEKLRRSGDEREPPGAASGFEQLALQAPAKQCPIFSRYTWSSPGKSGSSILPDSEYPAAPVNNCIAQSLAGSMHQIGNVAMVWLYHPMIFVVFTQQGAARHVEGLHPGARAKPRPIRPRPQAS